MVDKHDSHPKKNVVICHMNKIVFIEIWILYKTRFWSISHSYNSTIQKFGVKKIFGNTLFYRVIVTYEEFGSKT